MITKREVRRVAKPVVLIAEELSSATLDALGPDFEVRNCDGANRPELLAALGAGVDAVLITAATDSAEPIKAAAQMSRQRGRVILVGVADLALSRDDFYKKELSFQVS